MSNFLYGLFPAAGGSSLLSRHRIFTDRTGAGGILASELLCQPVAYIEEVLRELQAILRDYDLENWEAAKGVFDVLLIEAAENAELLEIVTDIRTEMAAPGDLVPAEWGVPLKPCMQLA